MSKKIIALTSLILCLVFAGGCFGNTTVQTTKEITTIAELMSGDDYKDNIVLAAFSAVEYKEAAADESKIKAAAAKSLSIDRFADADICAAGDKITLDLVCTYNTVKLADESGLELILGEGKLAKEIETAIIEAQVKKGVKTDLTVTEKLDLDLTSTVDRELKLSVTVTDIKHCELTAEELEAAKTAVTAEEAKEETWKQYVEKCKITEYEQTIIDAFKDAKRKSDANFASSYGKDVTITELTGLSNEKYEESLKNYAYKKYDEELVFAVMIKDNSKVCALTDTEKKDAYAEYAAMLGVDESKLSETVKGQIDDQLKKDKIKQYVFDSVKAA